MKRIKAKGIEVVVCGIALKRERILPLKAHQRDIGVEINSNVVVANPLSDATSDVVDEIIACDLIWE